MILGLILIIIGGAFLLQSLGYISGEVWSIIWPAILIVVGLGLILKRRDRGFFWEERFGWGKKEIIKKDYNPSIISKKSRFPRSLFRAKSKGSKRAPK